MEERWSFRSWRLLSRADSVERSMWNCIDALSGESSTRSLLPRISNLTATTGEEVGDGIIRHSVKVKQHTESTHFGI